MTISAEQMLASSIHALALPLGQTPEPPIVMGGGGGLPAGALYLPQAKLILCTTPCDAPMFKKQIAKACKALKHDILLQRTGLAPEVLNPVTVDVALISFGGVFCMDGLAYMRAVNGSLWLIPAAGAGFIEVRETGLRLTTEPPFLDPDERSDGLCRAAAEVVRNSRAGVR